ncbi:hypothetical protein R1flu_003425 [Riccia fluitans]|uniref:NB-ARC domain-containing protein n=1 Tax=Riccia fluitans TaxID=41844 RepID=A0ABD1Y909_9MARC
MYTLQLFAGHGVADQSEMESTRAEPIEASGNKYNKVSERGSRIWRRLRRMMTAASSCCHHPSQPTQSSCHHPSQPMPENVEQMSDGFYKFYEPDAATLDIFFFHGLECEGSNLRDAHISSWISTGEQEEVWPQKWLPEDFPQARIISVCYDSCIKQTDTDGRMDLHQIVENLMHEIKWARKEHDFHRPVILVGHGFRGIVIKKLCIYAQNKREKSVGGSDMSMFLDSIRAFFFYATPHLGIEGIEAPAEDEGPLLKWMRILNSESARLHESFSELCRARWYRWTIFGLGEAEATPGSRRGRLHVREASSRFGDDYITVSSDHFSMCKPSDRNSNKYQHLKHLIEDVQKRVELERSQSLMVPKVIVGVDGLVTEVLGKHFRDHKFVGFSGLGGVGKTTLAKIIFNRVCTKFEFTCFVKEIKLISGTKEEIKKKVWKEMRHHGRSVQSSSDGWDQVARNSMLLVFDDIVNYRHAELLQEIADSNRMGESRFLLTSRDTQCLRDCGDDVHIIPLDCLENRDAKKLLTAYAFPNQEPPESLEGVIQEIVVGCGGLPLTLEDLGKYLRSEPKEEAWAEIPIPLRKCEDIADLEQRVWAKLKLSYDRLPGDEVKNMFLDIACFFILDPYWSANDAMKAWSVTYTSAPNRVKLLEERSLLKVSRSKDLQGFDYIEFHVPEHVRRMGQRITQQERRSYYVPRSSSQSDDYPYDDQIISQEGKKRKGKKLGKIVAHSLKIIANLRRVFAQDCAFCIMRQVWPKLTVIQYMTLKVDVTNCCNQCRNQTVALPSTLLLLCLSLPALRDISVVTSRNSVDHMSGTLSLATCASLVRLVLISCCKVTSIPASFKELTSLRFLMVEEMIDRQVIPIGSFRQLRVLELKCWAIADLAGVFRELIALEELALHCEGISKLPATLGKLTLLKKLSVKCPVKVLPDSLGNLTNLTSLEVENCPIQSLPESLGQLSSLRRLEVTFCRNLKTLPDSTGD